MGSPPNASVSTTQGFVISETTNARYVILNSVTKKVKSSLSRRHTGTIHCCIHWIVLRKEASKENQSAFKSFGGEVTNYVTKKNEDIETQIAKEEKEDGEKIKKGE